MRTACQSLLDVVCRNDERRGFLLVAASSPSPSSPTYSSLSPSSATYASSCSSSILCLNSFASSSSSSSCSSYYCPLSWSIFSAVSSATYPDRQPHQYEAHIQQTAQTCCPLWAQCEDRPTIDLTIKAGPSALMVRWPNALARITLWELLQRVASRSKVVTASSYKLCGSQSDALAVGWQKQHPGSAV